jgi:hypothetical protein
MTKQNIELISELQQELENAENVIDFNLSFSPGATDEMIRKAEEFLEISLEKSWYNEFDGLSFSWKSTLKNDFNLSGRCNLISLNEVCSDWMDILYFEKDSPLNRFYPIDMFKDEALIGLYKGSPLLYLFNLKDEPWPLYIELKDYLSFIKETAGFLYWQKSLIAFQGKYKSVESDRYENNISSILPGHTKESLHNLYAQFRKPKKNSEH